MATLVAWEPRIALTAAEAVVDFPATNDHILRQRASVEDATRPAARRMALAVSELEITAPPAAVANLARRLETVLERTMHFGFREARREINSLRAGRRVTAAVVLPEDAGEFGELARQGRDGVRDLIRRRSQQASRAIANSLTEAAKTPGLTALDREALLLKTAQRALHNTVLELVGETLNMGRTAGALALPAPPEFAMRSEQLDKTTCDPCSRLHGEIAALGSPEYFALLPPTGCLGGGRCRGIMIFGDGPLDLRLPEGPEPLAPGSIEHEAIQTYLRSSRYSEINGYLRGLTGEYRRGDIPWIQEQVGALDSVIATNGGAPPRLVYRAFARPVPVKPGAVLDDAGFLSTTTRKELAESWADTFGDVWEIEVGRGLRALDVASLPLTIKREPLEQEWLFARGLRLVVLDVRDRIKTFPNGNTVTTRYVRARLERRP